MLSLKRCFPGILVVIIASTAFADYSLTALPATIGTSLPFLTTSGDTFYGFATVGSVNSYTYQLYSMPITGGARTVLATFDSSDMPNSDPTISGGVIYGSTTQGHGDSGPGQLYSVPLTGGTPTYLASFPGSAPDTDIIASNGQLYFGTDDEHNTTSAGVYSMPISGGTPTLLDTIQYAVSNLTLSGNTLYCSLGVTTTKVGVATIDTTDGEVLAIPLSGSIPPALATFDLSGSNGDGPSSNLVLSDGILYGEAVTDSDNGDGVIFSVPTIGGTPTVLGSFNGTDGMYPAGQLIKYGRNLYGITQEGGANGNGGIFSVPLAGGTPTLLASFPQGEYTGEALAMDENGNFYGTVTPGSYLTQTVFELSAGAPALLPPQTNANFVESGTNTTTTVTSSADSGTLQASFSNTTGGLLTVTSGITTTSSLFNPNNAYDSGGVNFALPGDGTEVQIWDLSYSGTFSGETQLVFDFDPTGMTLAQEEALEVFHYTGGQWVPIGGTVDLDDDTITVDTTSFSPFAIGLVPEPTTLSILLAGGLVLLARPGRGRNVPAPVPD
jgi:uncharacterized repeat protein (TIGR03803 family)